MNQTDCRYDYYQITMKVNLSEEDSCLFSRYGQSVFSIKKADSKKDCQSCSIAVTDPSKEDPVPMQIVASIPDASILSVEVDRCDCTKATFNLLVRLPCVRQCRLFGSPNDATTEYGLIETQYQTIVKAVQLLIDGGSTFLQDELNVLKQAYVQLTKPADCSSFLKAIRAMISACIALRKELVTDAGLQDDETDPTLIAIDALLVLLQALLDSMLLNSEPNNGYFRDGKFCITSGASGFDRELVTFYVKPLDPNIVSTGVFEKCYSYEITRVPGRIFSPQRPDGNEGYIVQCANGKWIAVEPPCTRPCKQVNLALVADTLHVTFPLTKELKCLLPDFGIPGTVSNAVLGQLTTIVKIVSNCPQKFSFPAKMTFDKINCTVCLEISASYVYEYVNSSKHPYNSQFGRFGCEVFGDRAKCSDENPLVCLFGPNNDKKVSFDQCCGFFSLLSMSRKLDVVGVHKCTEKTFFSFQICTVPYKPLCVDICGCKLQTIPDVIEERLASYAFGLNSYAVQADCNYTYEFSRDIKRQT
ncbi:hypothetical protein YASMINEVIRUS_1374 [Yasminevirus sp. GU-2018]|uniref:Uncharacterized protein n=1 Tax=Yasminevirus sp. GU-2018 TaxID=2420051 RepID=A0A5K0UB73_9VIRU|nr:hypothetical protein YASMINEVIRUS_1374 [Yasminevirus sp. GU-2018]